MPLEPIVSMTLLWETMNTMIGTIAIRSVDAAEMPCRAIPPAAIWPIVVCPVSAPM